MFEIAGLQRTNRSFLARVQKTSGDSDMRTVVDKLKRLRIFSTITEVGNGISVTEERRSISFSGDTTRDTPRGYFKLRLPNLFGKAESLEVSLSTSRDMSFQLVKPVVWRSLGFLSICGSRDVKRSPREEYPHTCVRIEAEGDHSKISVGRERIGYLCQSFLELQNTHPCLSMKAKAGALDTRMHKTFLKMQLSTHVSRDLGRRLFTSILFSTGMIFGSPHITERYHLGGSIRGYKDMSISPRSSGVQIGGKSFLEMTHKVGLHAGDLNAFVFGSVGYVSNRNNIVDTFRQAVRTRSYRDDECLGASVGLGVNVPVMKSKDGPTIGMSFAVPLTSNKQIQRLQFGFNMDF